MKKLGYLLLPLMLFSCQNPPSNPQDEKLGQELMQVADNISQLMASYHYNPGELQGDAYLEVEQKVKELAQNAQSKEEFREFFDFVTRKISPPYKPILNIDKINIYKTYTEIFSRFSIDNKLYIYSLETKELISLKNNSPNLLSMYLKEETSFIIQNISSKDN